jgi:hypothetical protein
MTYQRLCNKRNTKGATNGSAHPYEVPEFTPHFVAVYVPDRLNLHMPSDHKKKKKKKEHFEDIK